MSQRGPEVTIIDGGYHSSHIYGSSGRRWQPGTMAKLLYNTHQKWKAVNNQTFKNNLYWPKGPLSTIMYKPFLNFKTHYNV